ncbi:polycystin-1-like protein 3 [Thomomys bottae]
MLLRPNQSRALPPIPAGVRLLSFPRVPAGSWAAGPGVLLLLRARGSWARRTGKGFRAAVSESPPCACVPIRGIGGGRPGWSHLSALKGRRFLLPIGSSSAALVEGWEASPSGVGPAAAEPALQLSTALEAKAEAEESENAVIRLAHLVKGPTDTTCLELVVKCACGLVGLGRIPLAGAWPFQDGTGTGSTSSRPRSARPSCICCHLREQPYPEKLSVGSDEPEGTLTGAQGKLKEACEILQNLRDFAPGLPAQVPVVSLLVNLSEQMLQISSQNGSTPGSQTPATLCRFPPLGMTNVGKNQQTPEQDTDQVEDMLERALLALGKIQAEFLQQSPGSESTVVLTSSAASVLLSSRNVSTLPLSSYTLGGPAPVRFGLPSSSALEEFLTKHPGVKVHTFDSRNITGSIGSVLLSSGQEPLQVHDLIEDVEIVLWRNTNIDAHASSLNTSTGRFTVTMNITSVKRSLLVTIKPASPLFLTLYLGFQQPPDQTHFLLNTSLPQSTMGQKDEDYTWVLTPESLQYRTGTYYITAILKENTDTAWKTPILVSVVTAVTQCYFWDKRNRTWRSNGCQVGPQSTVVKTQCLCDHLTFFGSDFFVVPRTVKVEDTVALFGHVSNNPVGVSVLATLVGLYLLLAAWAWRKDQRDMRKVKVTVLADNDPGSRFHYLVELRTGWRRRAACSGEAVITLYGSEGQSQPRHLCKPGEKAFDRGALDVFLLGTRDPLGDLHALRLWLHPAAGRPAWYISQVIVSDMARRKKWHFLCHCWLATDLGDFQCDRVFMPASRRELLSFRHLFSSTIVERFTQDHLWLSLVARHPWSQFTRLQRLTCCTTLLLYDMVINVMFWRMEGPTAERDQQMGPLAVTWLEVLISIQTAVILLPAHLVIRQLSLWIQPRETLPPLPPVPASCLPSAAWEPCSTTDVTEQASLELDVKQYLLL